MYGQLHIFVQKSPPLQQNKIHIDDVLACVHRVITKNANVATITLSQLFLELSIFSHDFKLTVLKLTGTCTVSTHKSLSKKSRLSEMSNSRCSF